MTRIYVLLVATVGVVGGLGMAIAPDSPPGARAAGLVLMGVAGVVGARVMRLGVVGSRKGLRINGWFRDREISWDKVSAIDVAAGNSALPTHTLFVHLADGEVVRVQQVSSNSLFKRLTYVHTTAERLDQMRGLGSADGADSSTTPR